MFSKTKGENINTVHCVLGMVKRDGIRQLKNCKSKMLAIDSIIFNSVFLFIRSKVFVFSTYLSKYVHFNINSLCLNLTYKWSHIEVVLINVLESTYSTIVHIFWKKNPWRA